jgi:hypothetical protein
MTTLTDKINAVNNKLRSLGIQAIQKIEMKDREGKIIGQVKYGYRPQYVFDSINEFLGPENWRYELTKEEIFENQAVAEVKLFLKTDAEWLCKGSHKGQMQIIKGNVGDAQKGAITDAIQKCFSLISIGQDAYRGLLGAVYNATSQSPRPPANPTPPPQQQSKAPKKPKTPQQNPTQANLFDKAQPPDPLASLPKIAGVTYQQLDGYVVATGEKLFDKKELLKSAGFKWNSGQKNWFKDLTH